MFFREILNEDLGCASYIVADGGEAVVVDPRWEIEEYLEIVEENGFEITCILETHNHADHVSGRGRLVEATGAKIHISREAGVEYEHEPLEDGDVIEVGWARIVAIATPGHRPEHTASSSRTRVAPKSRGFCSPATRSLSGTWPVQIWPSSQRRVRGASFALCANWRGCRTSWRSGPAT